MDLAWHMTRALQKPREGIQFCALGRITAIGPWNAHEVKMIFTDKQIKLSLRSIGVRAGRCLGWGMHPLPSEAYPIVVHYKVPEETAACSMSILRFASRILPFLPKPRAIPFFFTKTNLPITTIFQNQYPVMSRRGSACALVGMFALVNSIPLRRNDSMGSTTSASSVTCVEGEAPLSALYANGDDAQTFCKEYIPWSDPFAGAAAVSRSSAHL